MRGTGGKCLKCLSWLLTHSTETRLGPHISVLSVQAFLWDVLFQTATNQYWFVGQRQEKPSSFLHTQLKTVKVTQALTMYSLLSFHYIVLFPRSYYLAIKLFPGWNLTHKLWAQSLCFSHTYWKTWKNTPNSSLSQDSVHAIHGMPTEFTGDLARNGCWQHDYHDK